MSFEIDVSPKELAGAEFVAKLGRALQRALLARKGQGKFTQQELALRLDIDRARVNRCFSGYANLTAESIGEIAWAMDAVPDIAFSFDNGQSQHAVQIIEFKSKSETNLEARKVLTLGTGSLSQQNVWVVVHHQQKHYSLPINFEHNERGNSAKIVNDQSRNWELLNLD
ncbi:helix-turn-helix domain-containing protein [Agrobacterium larrymoorei]|uniref:Plasmid maintenance system antidote protein VapI n=1 Tax=Agrobacterium larrymoorei TaxID=160699 RepID=A0ABU0UF29_9HYPH|nr:helix-turn-helix transcriptional regulator [Agrobacterium larrymoorei]MDQ1183549.1 plasmid maintenance system antidote protein VapI [Agrobacterium larrymoorei]